MTSTQSNSPASNLIIQSIIQSANNTRENNMSDTPEQLNQALFESALKSKFKEPTKILNYEITLASKKGENYTSDIYRVKVNYELDNQSNDCSFLVKFCLENEKVNQFLEDFLILEKEILMYEEILPGFKEILEEKLAADCYCITRDPTIFVFEDLKALDYESIDRLAFLDLEHCKLLMRKLGKFHAASVKLQETKPDVYKIYDFGMYKEYTKGYNFIDYAAASFQLFLDIIRDWEGFEKISEKLEKITDNFRDNVLACMKQSSEFKVLNHGDIWTTNAMFNYGIRAQ